MRAGLIGRLTMRFNSQPPEGGWKPLFIGLAQSATVSTHSRPKAAGYEYRYEYRYEYSFNSQPPEGGWETTKRPRKGMKCFNSQPPEGGWGTAYGICIIDNKFQLTAARRRLVTLEELSGMVNPFQLTAARRRLDKLSWMVCTH